jgi:hypothetical protein
MLAEVSRQDNRPLFSCPTQRGSDFLIDLEFVGHGGFQFKCPERRDFSLRKICFHRFGSFMTNLIHQILHLLVGRSMLT